MPGSRPDRIELEATLFGAALLGRELGVAVHVDAISGEQLLAHRPSLVPSRPVRALTAVAPVLVVDPVGAVVPLTHDVSPSLRLGSLLDERLPALAAEWLADGRGDRLVRASERAWEELAAGPRAVYWYDEVAVRTRTPTPARARQSGLDRGSRQSRFVPSRS
jgi:hypothetical protein